MKIDREFLEESWRLKMIRLKLKRLRAEIMELEKERTRIHEGRVHDVVKAQSPERASNETAS